MNAIADSGFVVSIANRNEKHHLACVEIYRNEQEQIYLPQTVLTEVAYLLKERAEIA